MHSSTRRKICFYLICLTICSTWLLTNQRKKNESPKPPVIPFSPVSVRSIVNISKEQFICNGRLPQSDRRISNIIQHNPIFNYLSFVLRSHSMFYCSIPKVATRTILIYLTYLHIRDELIPTMQKDSHVDLFNSPYIKQMVSSSFLSSNTSKALDTLSSLKYFQSEYLLNSSSKIDLWSLYQQRIFPLVRPQTLSDPRQIFSSDYLRIIFVRHPLERLASAYIDKIASLTNEPFSLYDQIRRVICREFASSYLPTDQVQFYFTPRVLHENVSEPCAKIIPRFEHFLEFLVRSDQQQDVHWKPYTALCFVCSLRYNFIGKFETLEEDLGRLTSVLNLNSMKINFFQNGKTKEFYRSMYSNLTDKLICFLKGFYRYDLLFFNYTVEEYFSSNKGSHCSVTHP